MSGRRAFVAPCGTPARDPCDSGGAAGPGDFVRLFSTTGADAGLAASIFHYGETTVAKVKMHLAAKGVPVRRLPGAA